MPFLPSTRPSPYVNHTNFVQSTLAKVNRRVYYSDGDFTYSSGDGRNSSPSNGLSSGDIVGIAIGGFIALVLVIGLILWSGRKSPQPAPSSKKKKKTQNGDGIQSNPPPANGGNVEPAVSGAIQGNDPQPPSQGSLHHMAGGLQENHPPTIVGRGEPAVAGVIHGNASQSLPQRSLPHGLRENPPTSNAGHGQPEVAGAIQGNAPQPPSQGSIRHIASGLQENPSTTNAGYVHGPHTV